MASGHLVAFTQLALGSDKNLDHFIDAGIKIIAFGALEALNVDNGSFNTVRNTERRIPDFFGFFAEDGVQELEFGSGIGFALGSNLTDENVARADLRANADDTFGVEVVQTLLAGIGNVPGELFRSSLVSRTSVLNSLMWMDVNMSSLTTRREMRMASS